MDKDKNLTQEEFQIKVLKHLQSIEDRLDVVETRLNTIDAGIDIVHDDLEIIKEVKKLEVLEVNAKKKLNRNR